MRKYTEADFVRDWDESSHEQISRRVHNLLVKEGIAVVVDLDYVADRLMPVRLAAGPETEEQAARSTSYRVFIAQVIQEVLPEVLGYFTSCRVVGFYGCSPRLRRPRKDTIEYHFTTRAEAETMERRVLAKGDVVCRVLPTDYLEDGCWMVEADRRPRN